MLAFFRLALRRYGGGAGVETRLVAALQGRLIRGSRCAHTRAPRQQPSQPRPQAEKFVGDPANDCCTLFAFGVFVCILGGYAESKTSHDRETDDGRDPERKGSQCLRQVRDGHWKPQHPVSGNAAKSSREGPSGTARQSSGARGPKRDAEHPNPQTDALTTQRTMTGEPPAPDCDGQDDRKRRQSKQLRQEVGDRRAADPEHVAHRSVGCVTETGILDGPGGEREAKRGCKQYQGCASKLAQSPLQRIAQRIGQKAQAVQAAIDD